MTSPAPSGSERRRPRQARSRQTVDAILQAAAEVFEAEGFEGGTIERIVERAGVSVGSLYQYFPDKRALLVALAEQVCAAARTEQDALLAQIDAGGMGPEALVRALLDCMVATHESQPRLRCLLFEERAVPASLAAEVQAVNARLRGAIARWYAARGRPDPDVKALVLFAAVASLVHEFVLHPRPELPPARAAEEVYMLALGYAAA